MPEQIAASAASPSSDAASVKKQSYEMRFDDALVDEDQTAYARQTVKSEVIQTLHAMIHERLFGNRPWIADSETAWAVDNQLMALGLSEPISGEFNRQATPLGRELSIDLMQVFMGIWEPYEVPMILENYRLLSEDEMLEVEECFCEEDPETVLLPLVRRAFFQHFHAGARLN